MFYTPFFDLTWSFFMLFFPFFLIPNYHFSFVIYHLAQRIPPQSFIQSFSFNSNYFFKKESELFGG